MTGNNMIYTRVKLWIAYICRLQKRAFSFSWHLRAGYIYWHQAVYNFCHMKLAVNIRGSNIFTQAALWKTATWKIIKCSYLSVCHFHGFSPFTCAYVSVKSLCKHYYTQFSHIIWKTIEDYRSPTAVLYAYNGFETTSL